MTAENQSFEMYSGDTKNIIIPVTDGDGEPLSLEGVTATWVLKSNAYVNEVAITKTIGDGIDIDGSEVTIRLDPSDTEGLRGLYYHKLNIIDAVGDVSTVTTGNVNIKR